MTLPERRSAASLPAPEPPTLSQLALGLPVELPALSVAPEWKDQQRLWGHSFHPMCSYLASFPAALAHAFIARYSRPGDVVLDPFSGRGTTALQASAEGRIGVGNDLNPFAHLLTAAKIEPATRADALTRLTGLRLGWAVAPEELIEAGYRGTAQTLDQLGGHLHRIPAGMHPMRQLHGTALEAQQAKLDLMEQGGRPEAVAQAQAAVEGARDKAGTMTGRVFIFGRALNTTMVLPVAAQIRWISTFICSRMRFERGEMQIAIAEGEPEEGGVATVDLTREALMGPPPVVTATVSNTSTIVSATATPPWPAARMNPTACRPAATTASARPASSASALCRYQPSSARAPPSSSRNPAMPDGASSEATKPSSRARLSAPSRHPIRRRSSAFSG